RPHRPRPRGQGPGPGHHARGAARPLRAPVRHEGPRHRRTLNRRTSSLVESRFVTSRVPTGLARLDDMLGGGLLPGTLAVVYGATGMGKTHLGLTCAEHGQRAEGARGVIFDMNGRGDSQQHAAYADRLFGWTLGEWTHTVPPMSDPYPPATQVAAHYSNALRW